MSNLSYKPEHGEFQTAEWSDEYGFWVIRDLTPEELAVKFPEPEPEPLALVDYAGRARWLTEISGITVGGIAIATDDRAKLMLSGARLRAEKNPDATEKWHADDGSVYVVTAPQIIAMSDAVAAHVSACFSIFADVKAKIDAGTITEQSQIDDAFGALSTTY